jgi:hypothetical protein
VIFVALISVIRVSLLSKRSAINGHGVLIADG